MEEKELKVADSMKMVNDHSREMKMRDQDDDGLRVFQHDRNTFNRRKTRLQDQRQLSAESRDLLVTEGPGILC